MIGLYLKNTWIHKELFLFRLWWGGMTHASRQVSIFWVFDTPSQESVRCAVIFRRHNNFSGKHWVTHSQAYALLLGKIPAHVPASSPERWATLCWVVFWLPDCAGGFVREGAPFKHFELKADGGVSRKLSCGWAVGSSCEKISWLIMSGF